MFEIPPIHFSLKSEQVLVEASRLAKSLRLSLLEPIYVLYALLQNSSETFFNLQKGFIPGRLAHQIKTDRFDGVDQIKVTDDRLIPSIPNLEQAFGYARREALVFENEEIEPEHLFLGLLRIQEIANMFAEYDITLDSVRDLFAKKSAIPVRYDGVTIHISPRLFERMRTFLSGRDMIVSDNDLCYSILEGEHLDMSARYHDMIRALSLK